MGSVTLGPSPLARPCLAANVGGDEAQHVVVERLGDEHTGTHHDVARVARFGCGCGLSMELLDQRHAIKGSYNKGASKQMRANADRC